MANTEVGAAYVAIYPNTNKFSENVVKGLNDIDLSKVGNGIGGSLGNSVGKGLSTAKIAIGNALGNVVSRGLDVITGSIDSAISRVDTLNNFPRVMANMGIASDAASAAIERLSGDALKGLPTTLDSAASAVQRLTSVNGDVGKSTDYFLALNNAILAGGADMAIQQSAIEQLSQSYSKGRMDMMEWRTLQMAMPAQLNQVAQAMGMTSDALGEGLRNGTISMDSFMDTLVQLNAEGTGEFASFEEQARASVGGIGTQMANLQTSVTRGVANIIQAVNSSGVITGTLSGISSAIDVLFRGVVAVIPWLLEMAGTIWASVEPAIQEFAGLIAEHMPEIQETVSDAMTVISAVVTAAMNIISAIVQDVWPAIKTIIETTLNVIKSVIAAISAAIKGDWSNFWRLMDNAARAAVDGIMSLVSMGFNTVQTIINAVMSSISGIWSSAWGGVTSTVSGAWSTVKTTVSNGVNSVVNFISSLPSRIMGIFSNAGSWLWNAGQSIIDGLIGGIESAVGWLQDSLSWVTSLIPDWKGPADVDAKLLVGNGELIMSGLTAGIENGLGGLRATLGGVTNTVQSYNYGSFSAQPASNGLLADEIAALRRDVNNMRLSLNIDGREFAWATVGDMSAAMAVHMGRA